MIDLSTQYLGLSLKNPLVPSSSPLSKHLDTARRLEDAGAAALVMYSLFEEELHAEDAMLDRFLLHVQVGYPNAEQERSILVLNRNEAKANTRDAFQPPELLSVASVMQARQEILRLHLAEELEEYIVNIVLATRNAGRVDASLEGQILYGASPRASIGIDRAARARAWLAGRDYVGPEDIQDVTADVLRHRLVLSFEAEADGVDANSVIERILDGVGVP